ncbi:MAG: preprotein translocase subunit SecA [Planctomycetota bacterium]|nr:preprotein translocase subunit SecA [Planctomycetota bacterium]
MGEKVGRNLRSLFGSRNERFVRSLEPQVARINELEPWAKGLDGAAFQAKTREWRKALEAGTTTLDDILPETFALVREASVRTLGLRHFDVQLVGGVVLHQGSIAEMSTGEGKTLVATLPLYLNALAGKPVYLVTVNDYLARRDVQWMGPIYDYLGMTCGAIQSQMHPNTRHPIYACDIVHGTNSEFGFDYLRDNMKSRVEDQVQRHLSYAIIDEVDSILIDEARTPLIISGPAEYMPDKYKQANTVAKRLERDEHFEVKEKERAASLLEAGIEEAERMLGVESFYTAENTDWPHYIENALRAHYLYENDREYVIENGEVVIVDEFTGRKMPGRRWSDGLHQAIETKEGLQIRQENQTLATITYQNYFRLYDKLAGMTGTAITEAGEFLKIYKLDVVSVPTNLPIDRADNVDVVYRTEPEKWKAIVEEIERLHEKGQPVLVGTTTVDNSEKLAGMLQRRGLPHEVLNAKNHEREAQIVAKAGEKGAVTVSTNMAGRGTDIKLGGNFEFRLKQVLDERSLVEGDPEHLAEIDRAREEVRVQCEQDEQEVLRQGGLYVLGTERHEARRIDNQLRGRSGRQGDVGESRFYLSLQDPLMRRFYKDWVTNAMEKLGMSEGVPIESGMVSRAIQKAQKKVEDYHFEIRKNLLEYDEVMDQQRKTIYGVRKEVLEGFEFEEKIFEMFGGVMPRMATAFEGDRSGFQGWFHRTFGFDLDEESAELAVAPRDMNVQPALDKVLERFEERKKEIGEENMQQAMGFLLLRTIDSKWMDHLRAMDGLRAGIGLRGYGQKDPKTEYKAEGFRLFEQLLAAVEDEVTSLILRVELRSSSGRGGDGGGPSDMRSLSPLARAAQAGQALTAEELARRAAGSRRRQGGRVPAAYAFDQKRRVDALRQAQEAAQNIPGAGSGDGPGRKAARQAVMDTERVGRNDPCPCGSGKKFKKCHGRAS